jgi:hypothetical protein
MGKDSPAREPSWSAFWLQKPSVLRVCVREEDAGERKAGAHSITPTYTAGKDSPAKGVVLKFFGIHPFLLLALALHLLSHNLPLPRVQ